MRRIFLRHGLWLLLGLAVLAVLVVLGLEWDLSKSDWAAWVQAVGSIAAIAAAVGIAGRQQRVTEERQASETVTYEALKVMERAYETFTAGSSDTALPVNSRVMWIAVARMILRYHALKSRVTRGDHHVILESSEEYFRHRLFTVLDKNAARMTIDYFGSEDYTVRGDDLPIDASTVAVIYGFTRMPKDDLLDGINGPQLVADGAVPLWARGALAYLERKPDYGWAVEEASKKRRR